MHAGEIGFRWYFEMTDIAILTSISHITMNRQQNIVNCDSSISEKPYPSKSCWLLMSHPSQRNLLIPAPLLHSPRHSITRLKCGPGIHFFGIQCETSHRGCNPRARWLHISTVSNTTPAPTLALPYLPFSMKLKDSYPNRASFTSHRLFRHPSACLFVHSVLKNWGLRDQ